MENNYYTPKIEELHVGFEYEYCWYSDEWEKQICTAEDIDDIQNMITENEPIDSFIRVKYLDRKDIEDLGFICTNLIEDDIVGIFTFNNKELLHYNYENNYCEIYSNSEKEDSYFKGTIKNKSELKRVMEMVGI